LIIIFIDVICSRADFQLMPKADYADGSFGFVADGADGAYAIDFLRCRLGQL